MHPSQIPNPTQPTMGRVVHYVDADGKGYPAIVRAVYPRPEGGGSLDPWTVDLTAFTEYGDHPFNRVAQDEEDHAPRRWHWPERV